MSGHTVPGAAAAAPPAQQADTDPDNNMAGDDDPHSASPPPPTHSPLSGEFLIDGLAIDGRNVSADEQGWADPATMSSLWVKKARPSPPSKEVPAAASSPLSRTPSSPRRGQQHQQHAKRFSARSADLDSAATCVASSSSSPTVSPTSPVAATPLGTHPEKTRLHDQACRSTTSFHSNSEPICIQCLKSSGASSASSAPSSRKAFKANRLGRWMGGRASSIHLPGDEEQQAQSLGAIAEEAADSASSRNEPSIGGTTITVVDIVQGRTCRPISLVDLRAFLAAQRSETHRTRMYQPASAVAKQQAAMLPDLSILGGVLEPSHSMEEKDAATTAATATNGSATVSDGDRTIVPSFTALNGDQQGLQAKPQSHLEVDDMGDELDALDFLHAFHRWQARFYQAHPLAAFDAAPSTSHTATLEEGSNTEQEQSEEANEPERQSYPQIDQNDPLRREMLRILRTYVGEVPASLSLDSKKTPAPRIRRLNWLSDLGLVQEQLFQSALASAALTTHPSTLRPLAAGVANYLNSHCLPVFFLARAKNLNHMTERGRLMVGLTCIAIAIAFTIAMALRPSPLYAGSDPKGEIPRWYRILLAPLWVAGIGYCLAAWTGVCMWLSLRGNREAEDVEITRRESMAEEIIADPNAEVDRRELARAEQEQQEARSRWMAPEIKAVLLWMTGRRERPTISAPPSPTTPTAEMKEIPSFALSPSPLATAPDQEQGVSPTQPAEDVFGSVSPVDSAGFGAASTLPIQAPAPIALNLASPSVKSRRLPMLPFEVAVIKPAALAAHTAIPEEVLLSEHSAAKLAQSHNDFAGPSPRTERRTAISVPAYSHPTVGAAKKRPARVKRMWAAVKHITGFAVDTEPVLDARVRREQQKQAFKALFICTLITIVILIITVAVP